MTPIKKTLKSKISSKPSGDIVADLKAIRKQIQILQPLCDLYTIRP